jgi:ABC-type transport system involved in multi-copper enzyme maturation permease subunit
MLWYKAWRESRIRFAITAFTLIVFCLFAVSFQRTISGIQLPLRSTANFTEHIYNVIYAGNAKGVFVLLVIILGLGGMLREQRYRTATFTLALPATRLRLLVTQILVGLSELAVLSLLPAVLLPATAGLVRQTYPVSQALHFSVLWFVCGSFIFSFSFLLSAILGGEYSALAVCYVALMLEAVIGSLRPIAAYRLSLMWIMGEFGKMHWDSRHLNLVSDALPWARLLVIMLIAFGLLALAARITQKQDY